MKEAHATFANFVLHFGDEVLIDYVKEIVLPAFTDDKLVRVYGAETTFHFYKCELVELSDTKSPIAAVIGRFIKDTKLSRTQYFEATKGLVKDERALRSAPSAFFVLILNNHRLIYFPETPHPPDLKSFEATALQFLRKKHKEFIDNRYKSLRATEPSISKADLYERHFRPSLKVVPLTGANDIEKFLERYDVLKRVELNLIQPNHDIDGEATFRDLRTYIEKLEPNSTKLVVSNNQGLNKETAAKVIHDATGGGNQEAKLTGVDYDGNELRGNSDEFKVTVPVGTIPASPIDLAKNLYAKFAELVKNKTIKIDEPSPQDKSTILNAILNLF